MYTTCAHTHKIIRWGLANDSSIRWLLYKHEDLIAISSVHIQEGCSDTYLWSWYWKGRLKIDPWSLLANQASRIFKLLSSVKVSACKDKMERDWGKHWTLTSGLYMHAWLYKHTHLIIGTYTQSNKHKSAVQLVCVLRQGLCVTPGWLQVPGHRHCFYLSGLLSNMEYSTPGLGYQPVGFESRFWSWNGTLSTGTCCLWNGGDTLWEVCTLPDTLW